MRYLVIVEPTGTGYSAYLPDVDGCVATGATREEVEQRMREAIVLHAEALREGGEELPKPTSTWTQVELPA